jgi:hypothetical protein
MRRSRLLSLFCFVLVWCVVNAAAADTEQYTVSARALTIAAGERITNFEIHVTAGAFRRVSHLPIGWYIDIDNDGSWQTKVTANCQVGAASLGFEEFQELKFMIEKTSLRILGSNCAARCTSPKILRRRDGYRSR